MKELKNKFWVLTLLVATYKCDFGGFGEIL
jgi:hypothetical protein